MVNKTGDICTFRDVTGRHKLTGASNDGIVQYEVDGKIYTTDESEIVHNFWAEARDRGISLETLESVERGLEQSANGETVSPGSFSQYAED